MGVEPASRPAGPVGAVLAVVEPGAVGQLPRFGPRPLMGLRLTIIELDQVRVDAKDWSLVERLLQRLRSAWAELRSLLNELNGPLRADAPLRPTER